MVYQCLRLLYSPSHHCRLQTKNQIRTHTAPTSCNKSSRDKSLTQPKLPTTPPHLNTSSSTTFQSQITTRTIAMTDSQPPLISQHPSTSGLRIALHPLALLTISDYITRHTLRNLPGAIVGALLGSQSGREIAIEHAYEVVLVPNDTSIAIDKAWFETKLRLCMPLLPPLLWHN
jgi:hypothetical protein